jgi:hypothetical protein
MRGRVFLVGCAVVVAACGGAEGAEGPPSTLVPADPTWTTTTLVAEVTSTTVTTAAPTTTVAPTTTTVDPNDPEVIKAQIAADYLAGAERYAEWYRNPVPIADVRAELAGFVDPASRHFEASVAETEDFLASGAIRIPLTADRPTIARVVESVSLTGATTADLVICEVASSEDAFGEIDGVPIPIEGTRQSFAGRTTLKMVLTDRGWVINDVVGSGLWRDYVACPPA